MAWPFSRLLHFIDRSPPWVSALYLNEVQDKISSLYGAAGTSLSLRQLLVDGVGGAAYEFVSSGAGYVAKIVGGLLVNAASATDAAIATEADDADPEALTRRLWASLSILASPVRIYFSRPSEGSTALEIAVNAIWNPATGKWNHASRFDDAWLLTIGHGGLSVRKCVYTGLPWGDDEWQGGEVAAGDVTASGTVAASHLAAMGAATFERGAQIGYLVGGYEAIFVCSGSDVAGTVKAQTGNHTNTPAPDGVAPTEGEMVKVTFAASYAAPPVVLITPLNPAATSLPDGVAVRAEPAIDHFSIITDGGALAPGETYEWAYHVIG